MDWDQNDKEGDSFSFIFSEYKTSDFWDQNDVSFIYIYNDNWSMTDLDWIQNRTGSFSDPHIIENVTINGDFSRSCITIDNCSDYFIIRNCTLYNSGASGYFSGIFLLNSNNGTLKNNTCYNSRSGIRLENSKNNTISENWLTNNTFGIFSYSSSNNTFFNNTINRNLEYGIFIQWSNTHRVFNNILEENNRSIVIKLCNLTEIVNNEIAEFSRVGIHIWFGHNNSINSNIITNQNFHFLFKTLPAIVIEDTLNNTLNGNNIFYVVIGIRLIRSNYTIVKNTNISVYTTDCYQQWDCNNTTNEFINITCTYIDLNNNGTDEPNNPEDNSFINLIISLFFGAVSISSGMTIYYFKQIRPKKKVISIEKTNLKRKLEKSKLPMEALNKEKILRVLDPEHYLNKESPLSHLNLTTLSEEFLSTIEKFNFTKHDENEFIKEMLSYPLGERKEFLKRMLKDLNLD